MICLLFLLSLAACAPERVAVQPEIVRITVTKTVPVPADLTAEVVKTPKPASATYGETVELWDRDRGIIDVLNARLRAIQALEDP